MSSYEMEAEDYLRLKDAEIASLREELSQERVRREAAEKEAEINFEAAKKATRENLELRKMVQSWADDADAEIARARHAEAEALEL